MECILCKTGRRHMVCIEAAKPEKVSPTSTSFRADRNGGLGCGLVGLAVTVVCVASVVVGYQYLDKAGWISRDHDTPVWIRGNWMVGEYRDCGMLTTTAPSSVVLTSKERAQLPRLFCGENWESEGLGEFEIAMPDPAAVSNLIWYGGDWNFYVSRFHTLPVRYQGRIDRPDAVFVSWRCQRQSASLECKALN